MKKHDKRYKISDNFFLDEFIHPDYYNKFVFKSLRYLDARVIAIAQKIRTDLDTSVTINNWFTGGNYQNSGLRRLDSKIGAKYSQHKYGRAIDIKTKYDPQEVLEYILKNEVDFLTIGLTTIEDVNYTPTWLHLDCRLHTAEGFLIVKP